MPAQTYEPPPIRGTTSPRFVRSFVVTLLLLALAWPVVTYFGVNHFDDHAVGFIQAAYARKAVAIQRTQSRSETAPPRLVIVTGSSGVFGIDAALMEHELHRPVVNLSIHAGLGAGYLLDRARRMLRDADDVLLAPEYELMVTPSAGYTTIEWNYVISYDKPYVFHDGFLSGLNSLYSQPLGEYALAYSGWRARLKHRLDFAHAEYDMSSMDAQGDLRRSPPGVMSGSDWAVPFPALDDSSNSVHCFEEFSSWSKQHHIRIFYGWPPLGTPDGSLPAPLRDPPPDVLKMLQGLGDVLDRPIDHVYPEQWFCDTRYHPNQGCRRIHTEQLISALRPPLGLPETATTEPAGIYLVDAHSGGAPDTPPFAFDDHPGTQARYFVTGPNTRHDALNFEQVSQLAERGVPIWFDDAAFDAAMAGTRWTSEIAAQGKTAFADWPARYPHGVFVVARAAPQSNPDASPLLTSLPDGPAVIVACPPFTHTLKVARTRFASFSTNLAAVLHQKGPDLLIELSKDSTPEKISIEVNHHVRASAGPGELGVVVIDPAMGTVIDSATFDPQGQATQWTLRRLVPRTR